MPIYKSKESYQKILDAQEKGHETLRKKILKDYYTNPKKCLNCLEIIKYEFRGQISKKKFCSQSCSAQYNNQRRKKIRYCKKCSAILSYRQKIFCSISCSSLFRAEIKIKNGTAGKTGIKNYLFRTREHRCQICGIDEWLGKPVLLILDHIDGNSSNSILDNLRLICSNCDATLPTYKSKNKGNGRFFRRKRYLEGKSY